MQVVNGTPSAGLESVEYRVAFAFPDVYEVGMSHLGLQILYDIVNRRTDTLMERVLPRGQTWKK